MGLLSANSFGFKGIYQFSHAGSGKHAPPFLKRDSLTTGKIIFVDR